MSQFELFWPEHEGDQHVPEPMTGPGPVTDPP